MSPALAAVERVEVDDDLLEYVAALVGATRSHPHIQVGASPRGGPALVQLARARAVQSGRRRPTGPGRPPGGDRRTPAAAPARLAPR
ncbi:hypothetical protein [Streptomyces sp. SID2888]|uniref:hypothetical protein n=1 Tax=Streptomyces sp. SID2888 TaxID=2690256 RepID=UPI001F32CE52|nr:hypothetical protein [Streptomyces sp. SID2888]